MKKINEDLPMNHAGMASEIELQKEYYEKGKVFTVQIESTKRCLQGCKYCYAGSLPSSGHGLSSEKIKGILDSAAQLDVRMIDWLGGDPLVRSDWYELCRYASDKGLINNIWTSGIPLFNPEIAKKAVEVTKNGFISTHLDTLDPQLYRSLHETSQNQDVVENIEKIIGGIKNTIEFGKDPGSMVNCITYTSLLAQGDARGMISYFQEKFQIKTCLTLFNPVIYRSSNEKWEPTINQIKEAYAHRDRVNYPEDPSCGAMDVSKFYCGSMICITSKGWLTPCSVVRTKEFGNIKQEPLEQLIEKNKRRLLFLNFRDTSNLPGKCSNCANNSFCFGCRSSAYYYEGDLLAVDPKCYQFIAETKNKLSKESS